MRRPKKTWRQKLLESIAAPTNVGAKTARHMQWTIALAYYSLTSAAGPGQIDRDVAFPLAGGRRWPAN
jgi:hypothetical protein